MQIILRYLLALFFISTLYSCADNGRIVQDIQRGVYSGVNQIEDLQRSDDPSPGDNTVPSYDTYRHEREKMMQDKKGE